ncbi:MAG: 2-phospho-L-lactate guanylyltransferase [Hadesarchaea archaeon]|nr:MAG: 2-phospho-L-lactate guanylyltransferase [Hadesarchaea archaeon]
MPLSLSMERMGRGEGLVLLPVKSLSRAKSSFEGILTPEERRELVLCMLTDMLRVLSQVGVEKMVVSPDEEVLRLASSLGARTFREPGLELNLALSLARGRAMGEGAGEVLILPADLPFLRVRDVEELRGRAEGEREVVLSPSRTLGTNALLLRPPDVIPLRFGGESFPLHVRESLRAGIRPKIYRSPTLATDVDGVEDLLAAETLGLGTRTREFLLSLGKNRFAP